METNLMQLDELFHLENQDLRSYSPLTLAYIGDGVYELIIRTILVKKGNCPVNQLHKKASSLVKAGAQSKMMELLEPDLQEGQLSGQPASQKSKQSGKGSFSVSDHGSDRGETDRGRA